MDIPAFHVNLSHALTVEAREALIEIIASLEEEQGQKVAAVREKYAKEEADRQQKLVESAVMRARQQIEVDFDLSLAEIDNLKSSEGEKTRLRLEAERARLEAIRKMVESGQIQTNIFLCL